MGRLPLTKVLLCYSIGIIWATYCPTHFTARFYLLALAILFFLVFYFKSFKLYASCSLLLLVITLGGLQIDRIQPQQKEQHHANSITEKKQQVVFALTARLKSTKKARYIATVQQLNKKPAEGKILLHIANKNLQVGDIILANTVLLKIRSRGIPGNFNYQEYLARQGIYTQAYLNEGAYTLVTHHASFQSLADKIRSELLAAFSNSGCNKKEQNVIAALLFGQQQDIDQKLMADYRDAGAVHILSVSGLHIGFIILFLQFILNPLGNTKEMLVIKLVISLVMLWSFAFLAALAPSVIRAATMYSILSVGTCLKRPTNIYHTLAASACLILAFEPNFLFDIGFQLSYAALIAIVYIDPILAKLWEPKNKISIYCYRILTVSVAAQIGTLPLSLFYFHQFPALFFITNLLIIPILSVVMITALVAVISATIGTIPLWLAKVLEWQIKLMNYIIEAIASIDEAIFKHIPINAPLMLAGYLFIILFFYGLSNKNRQTFPLIGLVICQASLLTTLWYYRSTREIIIGYDAKSVFMLARNGLHLTAMGNIKTESLQQYAQSCFVPTIYRAPMQNCIIGNNLRVFIADGTTPIPPGKLEIMVLLNNPPINLARVISISQPKKILVAGNPYPAVLAKWETTCREKKIPFHNIREKGPFILQN